MPEIIDNPYFLYADDAKFIRNWFDFFVSNRFKPSNHLGSSKLNLILFRQI